MSECEKIDNVLLKLEYELLGSSLCINLSPSLVATVLLCSKGRGKKMDGERERERE